MFGRRQGPPTKTASPPPPSNEPPADDDDVDEAKPQLTLVDSDDAEGDAFDGSNDAPDSTDDHAEPALEEDFSNDVEEVFEPAQAAAPELEPEAPEAPKAKMRQAGGSRRDKEKKEKENTRRMMA